jgi:serine/threonine protein kinase
LADLLTKMNEKDMNKRIDINEVMEHPYFEGTNFSELPSYEEAFQQVSDEEREYEVITKELNEILMMKENEPPL